MERLTERNSTDVGYIGRHAQLPGLENASTMRVAAIREVMQRLAEYEDTGLEPEQIKILAACGQYEQLVSMLVDTMPQLVQAIVERLPQLVELAVNAAAKGLQEA